MSDWIHKAGKLARKLFPRKIKHAEPIWFNSDVQNPKAMHSGNIGDIIFSCLFLKAQWEKSGIGCSLHLRTGVPFNYSVEHPLEGVLLNEQMATSLSRLLMLQPYITSVSVGPHDIDCDWNLDLFRNLPIDHSCGLVPGYFQLCTDLFLDVYNPWITAPDEKADILVSRTARLNSPYIDYRFLKDYADRLTFVGLPLEYHRFVAETGITCKSYFTWDFIELTSKIKACKLFIGNQGFLYTLAESVKCPRLLESNLNAPNNYPMSSNGRIAVFQKQFESFFKELNGD